MMDHAERVLGDCDLGYQYSPELFNETEPDFSLEVCSAVMDVWQPEAGRGIILNFPTTVERSLPNVFADQIEWLDRNLPHREHVCLSVHPPTTTAAPAWPPPSWRCWLSAERIEGCLFGNGERAEQRLPGHPGHEPVLPRHRPRHRLLRHQRRAPHRRAVQPAAGAPPRHPYGGDLVYTAFSGSHQDAIKKGFDERERQAAATGADPSGLPWRMPYLPVDPKDVGRTYEAVVRVNSQSGKGGVAYVMSAWHGLNLPRGLQAELAARVQERAETLEGELSPSGIGAVFREEYLYRGDPAAPLAIGRTPLVATLHVDGRMEMSGPRADAVRTLGAALAPWGVRLRAVHRTAPPLDADLTPEQPALAYHSPDDVVVYAECGTGTGAGTGVAWGAGIGADVTAAALSAVRAAGRRLARRADRLDPGAGPRAPGRRPPPHLMAAGE
ncbi:2-isopropylmalate synthase [Nonomuraea ferruginea]